ncbi:hypothetical protein BX600DRAFT_27007 [Xylariales sp. PMI_506]|nr:hypothetical protein BX600DRAFT_27007 [Xylariales sp. PMI_506]
MDSPRDASTWAAQGGQTYGNRRAGAVFQWMHHYESLYGRQEYNEDAAAPPPPSDATDQPEPAWEHDSAGCSVAPCTHPYGYESCLYHHSFNANSSGAAAGGGGGYYTSDPPSSRTFGSATSGNVNCGFGVATPPTVDRYVRECQPHELVATGHGTHSVKKSKRIHRERAMLSILDKDLKIQDRRT